MDQTTFLQARERIAPYVKPSPLFQARSLSQRFGSRVFFKCETEQPTGSFKVRPAFNGILSDLEDCRRRGVIASSSGNFAQAVAYASRTLGVRSLIVMPNGTSPYKMSRTRDFGGEVHLCEGGFKEREAETARLAGESGRVRLYPFDSEETIAGDGTIGLELLEQLPGPFDLVVPVSGGGLIAGIASVVKERRPQCHVIGVQPEGNGSLIASWRAGRRVAVERVETVADALVASIPGERTFPIIQRYVDGVVCIDDGEILEAVRFMKEAEGRIVEPGGAVGVAALLAGKVKGGPPEIVCLLSGCNVADSSPPGTRA